MAEYNHYVDQNLNRSSLLYARLHPATGVGAGVGQVNGSSYDGQVYYNTTNGDKHLYVYDSQIAGWYKLPRIDIAETVTGLWNFARGTSAGTAAPFTVGSEHAPSSAGSTSTTVTNLSAGYVNGYTTATANTASTVAVRDSGGRLSVSDPVSNQDAVSYIFLQGYTAGLKDPKDSCDAATTQAVYATHAYTVVSNVMTFTANGSINTFFSSTGIDGVTDFAGGERILFKNEAAGSKKQYNGIWVVTQVGSAGTPCILTRATDADSSSEVTLGMTTCVVRGTTNAGAVFQLNTTGTITLNTTELNFTQINGLAQIVAGSGMTSSGNTLNVGTASASRIVVNADDIDLATTAVTAGSYGGAASVGTFTVDAYGRLTAASNVSIAIGASAITSGTLAVARGGTNSAATLNNNRIMVSSAGAIVEAGAMTNGQLLIGSTGAAPVVAALTQGSNITITNGAGSITIAAAGSGISGSGTTGYLTRWTGTGSQGNSVVYDDGTNVHIGGAAPLAQLDITKTAIGVTQNNAYGLLLANTTSAANNSQQMSAPLRFRGNGWGTTGSASQTVDMRMYVVPVQGTTATGYLLVEASIAGAAYAEVMRLTTAGVLTADGSGLTALNASNLSTGTVPLGRLSGITTTQLSGTAGITNAQLANSSVTVTAGTGMSGGGAVSLGGSITLTNAGVTSVGGTSNQVNVSANTGAVTFSLPQSIATSSTPQFAGLGIGAAWSSNYGIKMTYSSSSASASYGVSAYIDTNAAGVLCAGYFEAQPKYGGTHATAAGLQAKVSAYTGTTITFASGVRVLSGNLASGTITSIAGVYIEDQALSGTTAWGVYQVGTTDKNWFAGRTYFGGTVTAATALVHLGAGTATASTAPLKFTTGTLLTTAEAGAVEFNSTWLYFSPANSYRFALVMIAVTTIGDGSSTSFTFTHNMGTKRFTWSLRDKNTDRYSNSCQVTATSTTQVTLDFTFPPTASQFEFVMTGAS